MQKFAKIYLKFGKVAGKSAKWYKIHIIDQKPAKQYQNIPKNITIS